MSKTLPMSLTEGQEIAVKAFAFLAADSARIGRFLALSGIDPADLRRHAGSAAFLCGVLEHVLHDETLLLTFCTESHIDPACIALARGAVAMDSLPSDGADEVNGRERPSGIRASAGRRATRSRHSR